MHSWTLPRKKQLLLFDFLNCLKVSKATSQWYYPCSHNNKNYTIPIVEEYLSFAEKITAIYYKAQSETFSGRITEYWQKCFHCISQTTFNTYIDKNTAEITTMVPN